MKKSKIILAILVVTLLALTIIPNSFAADNTTNTTLNTTNTVTNPLTIQENTSNNPNSIHTTTNQQNNTPTQLTNNNQTSISAGYSSGTFTDLDDAIQSNSIIYLTGNVKLTNNEYYSYIDGININKAVTIDGQGYTIDGSQIAPIFLINKTVTLKNLILTGGYTDRFGGCIYLNDNAKLILNNVTFINNKAKYSGAITAAENSQINITDCKFINCTSYGYAGAIYIHNGILNIKNSIFTDDYSSTDAGGAIYSEETSLTVTNTNFTHCNATIGGAIAQLDGNLKISNCNFQYDNATYYGGAIYNIYSSIYIYQSNFLYNSAIDGGALYVDNSSNLKLQSSNFTSNVAYYGGVIYSYQNNIFTNTNNLFSNNYAVNGTIIYYQPAPIVKTSNNQSVVISTNNTYITNIPSKYDLGDYGYLTLVKHQGDSGSCWALSAMASLESCILKANGVSYNLSEENLKNLMALYSQYKYSYSYPNDGGLNEMVYGYLAGWLGPVNESQEAYDEYSGVSPLLNNVMNIQNILTITRTSYTDNDAIKLAILNYGAVSVGMYYDDDYLKFDSYYYNGDEDSNHGVCIVGWDDSYSKSNFRNTPAGDGAWIIRNTWGPYWGDNGYFYVSYYDTKLAELNLTDCFTFILNDSTKYDKNYQYDYVAITDYLDMGYKTAWYSVAYNATGNEYLEAISTYFKTTTDYTASIYVNNVLKTTQSGFSNSGYYTIKLAKNVSLNTGDVFKIVMKIKTNSSAGIPVQDFHNTRAEVYPGVSYYSLNGKTWTDLATYNYYDYSSYYGQVACLKGFTVYKNDIILNVSSIQGEPGESQTVNIGVSNSNGNIVNNGIVTVNLDDSTYSANVVNGVAKVNIQLPDTYGVFNTTVTYSNGTNSVSTVSNVSVINSVSSVMLVADNFSEVYGAGKNFTGKLLDSSGNPIVGRHISLNLHRVNSWYFTYWATTDLNGEFKLPINLAIGDYIIQSSFSGDKLYSAASSIVNSIKVIKSVNSTVLMVNNFSEVYGAGKNFTGKLLDSSGNPIVGHHISLNLHRVNSWYFTYWATTDLNGEFKLPINLAIGSYTIMCSYAGTSKYSASSSSASITVNSLV